jgi:hypothetical protein
MYNGNSQTVEMAIMHSSYDQMYVFFHPWVDKLKGGLLIFPSNNIILRVCLISSVENDMALTNTRWI